MNVAIVGGSGFIGTVLARELDLEGTRFFIVDKTHGTAFPDRTVIADVRDEAAIADALTDATVVVNLAAEHRDDVKPVSLYDSVNIDGARNICRAAELNGIRDIIFTSSVAVYGFAPPMTGEDGPCNPFNDYGRTKLQAESVYNKWYRAEPDRRLAVIRPTVVFGEGNRGNVYNLFRQIATGRFLFVGDGRNHKAMAYVGNVSAFLRHLLHRQELSGTWNYVDSPIPEMRELVTMIRGKLGIGHGTGIRVPRWIGYLGGWGFDLISAVLRREFPVSRIRIRKFTAESSYSAERVLTTGFHTPYSLMDSLERVLNHEFPTLTASDKQTD